MLFAAHKLNEKDMKKVKFVKHRLKSETNKDLFLELLNKEYQRLTESYLSV